MAEQNKDLYGVENFFLNNQSKIKTRKCLILKKTYYKNNKGLNKCTIEKVNNNTYHNVKPMIRVEINKIAYNELIQREKAIKHLRIKNRLEELALIENYTQHINRLRFFGKFGHELQWIYLGKTSNNSFVFILDGVLNVQSFVDISKTQWGDTQLQKWLNTYFFDEAFDDYEKSIIVPNVDDERVTLLYIDLYNAYSDKNIRFKHLRRPSYVPNEYWTKSSSEQGFFYINEYEGLKIGKCTDSHSIRPVICINIKVKSAIENCYLGDLCVEMLDIDVDTELMHPRINNAKIYHCLMDYIDFHKIEAIYFYSCANLKSILNGDIIENEDSKYKIVIEDNSLSIYSTAKKFVLPHNGIATVIEGKEFVYALNDSEQDGMEADVIDLSFGFLSLFDRLKKIINIDNIYAVSCRGMFAKCEYLETIDLTGLDTSQVTDMAYMFSGCSNIEYLDVSGFKTSNVTTMRSMFYNCFALEKLDISYFDTSKVTDMTNMFGDCSGLKELNLNGFNTSQVISMSEMFCECECIEVLDLSSFNFKNVKNMNSMFEGCLELKLLNFGSSSITEEAWNNMDCIFEDCNPELTIIYKNKKYNIQSFLNLKTKFDK